MPLAQPPGEDHADVLDAATRIATRDAAAAIDSVPRVADSLRSDREAGRFSAWGRSTVIDELTRGAVLDRSVFDELHHRAGLKATWPVGNAGVIHCYGYLFSDVWTPHGLKRDRWLSPHLARAYGLPDDAFDPWAGTATLLQRATAAMTRALDDPIAVTDTGRAAHIDIAVDDIDTRVAVVDTGAGCAVAYAVDGLLITTFPISSSAASISEEIRGEPARLRWNAVGPA